MVELQRDLQENTYILYLLLCISAGGKPYIQHRHNPMGPWDLNLHAFKTKVWTFIPSAPTELQPFNLLDAGSLNEELLRNFLFGTVQEVPIT